MRLDGCVNAGWMVGGNRPPCFSSYVGKVWKLASSHFFQVCCCYSVYEEAEEEEEGVLGRDMVLGG